MIDLQYSAGWCECPPTYQLRAGALLYGFACKSRANNLFELNVLQNSSFLSDNNVPTVDKDELV